MTDKKNITSISALRFPGDVRGTSILRRKDWHCYRTNTDFGRPWVLGTL